MKIPKQAKQVFKGVIFDVYQWPQKMYDGSCKTFEMLKRADTVQIIAVTKDKKILLAKQKQPQYKKYFYSVLGGRVDKGETPLQAAKREMLEEAGYQSNDWELVATKALYHKIEWTMYNFVARDCKKISEQSLDAGEKIKILPVNFQKFLQILLVPNFRSQDIALDVLKLTTQNKLNQFKKKLFKKCRPTQIPRRISASGPRKSA